MLSRTHSMVKRLRREQEFEKLGLAACGVVMITTSFRDIISRQLGFTGMPRPRKTYVPISAHWWLAENVAAGFLDNCSTA